MRFRTVVKLGVIFSVILFCIAVGYYGFTQLSMTEKENETNLFSLVPAEDCIGVLESDNINYFIDMFPQLNYGRDLSRFHFPGLFYYVLGGVNEYTTNIAHGLSSRMSHLMVSFHEPGSPRDQVLYFRLGDGDEKMLNKMLQQRMSKDVSPKKEKYKGNTLRVYPLLNGDFLWVYNESDFFAVSYRKDLIEQLIDAKEGDKKALVTDPVFTKAVQKQKSQNFLTLYGRVSSVPSLQSNERCWSEFDFHMSSDVLYLMGETFLPDTCSCLPLMMEKLRKLPDVREDSLLISANKEAMGIFMDEAYGSDSHDLFNECVANLSRDAAFMFVADMNRIARDPEQFTSYLPRFLWENASLFRSFILSVQLSLANDRLFHIIILTYKD